jgi:hypothetical protein
MTISLKHTTQAVGTNAGNGEIAKEEWNEEHTLTAATDTLLGRASAGTGAVEEITCTAAGRAILDDVDAAAQRTTLGLGTGDSPQFTAVNIGNASDTTVTRVSAGTIAVEGIDVLLAGKTDTISVGYTVTPYNNGTKSTGTFTPDPANGNYQYYTNGGAHTLAAPGSDCAIDILVINGSSGAGSITMSGFKTAGTGVSGATYTTTANTWWVLSIRRINAISTFVWNGPWT